MQRVGVCVGAYRSVWSVELEDCDKVWYLQKKWCKSVLTGDFDKFGSWFYVVGFFEKRFFGVVGLVAGLCGFW